MLAEDAARLGSPRPGRLRIPCAATSDGVCLVAPVPARGLTGGRAARTAAAAAAALAMATGLGFPLGDGGLEIEAGAWSPASWLALRVVYGDELSALALLEAALEEQAPGVDRVDGFDPVELPAGDLDDTVPVAARWLWRAELIGRLQGKAGANTQPAEIEDALAVTAATLPPGLDPADDAALAHTDPVPARRAVRRILRRLDGMGKYGGFHTEFSHLARGFPGHERRLALEAGEALLEAGLLGEKPSVGQRHVMLVAARTGEIKALIETGETSDPALLAFFAA